MKDFEDMSIDERINDVMATNLRGAIGALEYHNFKKINKNDWFKLLSEDKKSKLLNSVESKIIDIKKENNLLAGLIIDPEREVAEIVLYQEEPKENYINNAELIIQTDFEKIMNFIE
jgi:hypothetical protein